MDGETISVSLGCWYFALDLGAPALVRPSEFFERVRGCLERIDGVSDIVIDLMALPGEDEAIELEPPKDPRRGEYLGPHWNFESVEFDVHLPLGTQRDLLAPHRALTGREATNFRVVMAYGWAMPISCVALNAEDTSQAAVAVFRYLERETEASHDGIRVRAVPPIFTHTDLFLHRSRSKTVSRRDFAPVAIEGAWNGRHDLEFSGRSSDVLMRLIREEIGSPLDVYYQVVHREAERQDRWLKIDEVVKRLLSLHRRGGARGALGRFLGTRRLANEATIRIAEFAARDHVELADLQRRLKQLEATDTNAFICDLAESALEERDEYPVEQFGSLVRLLEERRLTDREMVVLLVASLLGGAAGAVATLLAST